MRFFRGRIVTGVVGLAALLAVPFGALFSGQPVEPAKSASGDSGPVLQDTSSGVPADSASLVFAGSAGGPATVVQPIEQGNVVAISKDKPWDNINSGSLQVRNNVWGAPENEKLSCGVYFNDNKSFGWVWNRSDPQKKGGNEFVQPIYPSVRVGASPWDASNSAYFPVKLQDTRSLILDVSYTYRTTPDGTYNLAYDMFLSSTNQPSSTPNPDAEVMIWLHGTLGQPADAFKGDFSDGSNMYSLYSFVMANGRQYYAFILKDQTGTQGNLTVNAGQLLSTLNLDPAWYIHGIELGNEVVNGSGKIEIDKLTIDLNGHPV